MKILIATDAWLPQTNGVVQTLRQTSQCLRVAGHEVEMLTPESFHTVPCPSYPEIRLSLLPARHVRQRLHEFAPDAIHIATEGPIGFAMRRACLDAGLKFTTSYHTQFPEYMRTRAPIPLAWPYAALRWFHGAAERCMVSTPTMEGLLRGRGFTNIARWQRGVDTDLFRPRDKSLLTLPRPIACYVGRLAVEKNIDAFLEMPWAGSKLLIGDGPERARLQQQYPEAVFAGFRFGEDLASQLAAADIMVFPSLTDTFGLVNLEAMACGVPVAAFPVTGPIDVIDDGVTGALDTDLGRAAQRALLVDPQACRDRALRSDWHASTRQFAANLFNNRAA